MAEGRLPGLCVYVRDTGPVRLEWARADQGMEVVRWMEAHGDAVAETDDDDQALRELERRRVEGLDQVHGLSEVRFVFLHANLRASSRCPCIVMLLYGEFGDRARDEAVKHKDVPMGEVIFNGILVGGYWAVRHTADDSSVSRFCWWFHHKGEEGKEARVEFEHSMEHSTDGIMVYGSVDSRGEWRQLNALLLSVEPQRLYTDGTH